MSTGYFTESAYRMASQGKSDFAFLSLKYAWSRRADSLPFALDCFLLTVPVFLFCEKDIYLIPAYSGVPATGFYGFTSPPCSF